MRILFFIREILKKFPFLLIFNTFLLTVTSLVDATTLLCVAPIVDLLIGSNATTASPITRHTQNILANLGMPYSLGTLLIVFVALNFLKSGFQICATYLILKTKYTVLRDIMVGSFEDFFNAQWPFFSRRKQGHLLNTFTREVGCVGDAFGAMARFFSSLLQVVVFMAVPFYLSWQTMSVSLAATLVFALPLLLAGRITYRLGQENTRTSNLMTGVIYECLNAAKIIMGYAKQRKSVIALARAFDAHKRATLKSQTIELSIPHLYFPLGLVVLIITLVTARRFSLPLAEISILIYALFRITPIIGQILGYKAAMESFFPSYEQIRALRDRARQLHQKSGEKTFNRLDSDITIENLSFSHPGRPPALIGINARILKGKMIAFVGESGAGKSTLVDLIMGFYSPSAGRITIDKEGLELFNVQSYRQKIGYVPQESTLFNMSIRDNLLWASESATDDQIRQACVQANAHHFIEKLTRGYDTVVGDRGVRLSGGQVQRIALARAILRNPLLLILDEATSSLDSHSEQRIQQAIEKIAQDTTVITIAHRLSTISNADYIYVLENGQLLEQGSFSQLVSEHGKFYKMLQLQDLALGNNKRYS